MKRLAPFARTGEIMGVRQNGSLPHFCNRFITDQTSWSECS